MLVPLVQCEAKCQNRLCADRGMAIISVLGDARWDGCAP